MCIRDRFAGGGGGIFHSIFGGGASTTRPFEGARESSVGQPAPTFSEAPHHGVLSVDGSFSNEEYDEDEDGDEHDEHDAFGDFGDDDYDYDDDE